MSAVLCSNTALVDESLYHPIPGAAKRHDAIYDARLSPFKRHLLAERIERLALLTAPASDPGDAPYAEEIRRRLAHAHWCNPPFERRYRSLGPAEVNVLLNGARVGLCLSAVEGGMYASMQYLLAGLPVVSTPSVGGRDVFYDPDYTAIVKADAAAVAEGVRRMAACPVPPETIRARTLGRIREHRNNLIDLVDRICREEGRPRRFADDWPGVFIDKLARYRLPFGPVVRRIRAPGRGATRW
jgi:glycosyltransferase involved in cell wall biosynthesis